MGPNASTRIKCGGCERNYNPIRFSGNAIKKYWSSVQARQKNPKAKVLYPLCNDCHVGNRHELTCCMCDATKELGLFSKAQRKNPDNALCLDCQQEKLDREPMHDDEVEEVKILEQKKMEEKSGRSYQSSLPSSRSPSLIGSQHSQNRDFGAQDGFAGNEPPNVEAPSLVSTYQSSDRSSLSTNGITSTIRYGRSSMQSDVSHHSSSQVSRGGFAKQNAVKKDRETKARERYEREKKREAEAEEQIASDDSSDDDEDEDKGGSDEEPY